MTRRVRGDGAVADALGAASEFARAQSISEDERTRLCVIVEELVANLYDHGGVTSEQDVSLEFIREDGGIRMILVDPGLSFDPRTAPPHPPLPGKGAGAGIDLIRAWSRMIDYRATPQGNRLELLMPLVESLGRGGI